jgi:hypothetical protein
MQEEMSRMRKRMMWSVMVGLVAPCGALMGAGSASAAIEPGAMTKVVVGGAVTTPATYTRADLLALPQTTVQTTRQTIFGPVSYADEGVSLQALVNLAHPVLPAGPKNPTLRVTINVAGKLAESVTVALGELDPNFGNHPAVVVLNRNGSIIPLGPQLVIPGDATDGRTVRAVTKITVGVQNPSTTVPAHPGDLTVTNGSRTSMLSASQLAALPAQTRTVSFLAGTSSQTHSEHGPTLAAVLLAARIPTNRNTWVAAAASDGYVATVTPGEAVFGGRPLLMSLVEDAVPQTQPRLVVDGDVKGGRYVSGVTKLVVGQG